jgi:hypothetical protein
VEKLGSIGDVVALTTLAGVTVYVVGLIGLAIVIWIDFTEDIATAWYAVSLLPRTVVAGQGIRIWLFWPVSLATVLTLLALFAVGYPDRAVLVPTAGFLFFILLFGLVLLRLRKANKLQEPGGFHHAIAVTIVAGFLGGLIMTKEAHLVAEALAANDRMSGEATHNFLLGALFFVGGGLLVGLAGAITIPHPLPSVRIDGDPGSDCVKGALVTHADGFWHLFDEKNELRSIRDEQVSGVRMGRGADSAEGIKFEDAKKLGSENTED